MLTVDSLDIQISAQASSASKSLDELVNKLDRINASLMRTSGSGLATMAVGVGRLASAMQEMNNVPTSEFSRLTRNLEKLGSVDVSKMRSVSVAIGTLRNAMDKLSAIPISDSVTKISSLAKGIAQLGYKSSTQAITNIPKLATAMEDLIRRMSKLPAVSQNLINFTNALAKLSRTGASSGKAVSSLSGALNKYSESTTKAKSNSFSLASVIGKVYATYWMLFRALGKIKDAINISSDLTEVQNVVDTTFGKYASSLDKMAETSIQDFGMSELTVKQVASRFQAMGTAMGFTQGKMADMSIELTKLTADMASFYNVEQKDVAEDLESVFTGQARPLRAYGLDLTEATLKEFALKNGLNANISAMSQAEKTMLRYQYVMANTGAAQGDYARTADTWHNSVTRLKQGFEALGATLGGTFINWLKPAVNALNVVIGKLNEFAVAVSNSLGKIFGWQYETSGGGMTTDFEDAESAAGGIANSTGSAANNAKKLKDYLLGIDELNVVSPDDDTDSGSSGGSGGSAGGTGVSDASVGQWVKTDSILKAYESELDTLYKLGDFIGTKLTDAMNNIPWESIYEGARNFGTGLADFLNGLISPELFGAVGRTIASSLNTAIYSVLSFGETFDWEGLGSSITTGINDFFNDFDFESLAETLNVWVDGLEDLIEEAIDTLDVGKIVSKLGEFLGSLEIDTVEVIIGTLMIKAISKTAIGKAIKGFISEKISSLLGTISLSSIGISLYDFTINWASVDPAGFAIAANGILEHIGEWVNILLPDWCVDLLSGIGGGLSVGAVVGSWFPGVGTVAGAIIGAIVGALHEIKIDGKSILNIISEKLFNYDTANAFWEEAKKNFEKGGFNIVLGIIDGILSALSYIIEPIKDLFDFIWEQICSVFGIHSPATTMYPVGKNIVLGILVGLKDKVEDIAIWFNEKVIQPIEDFFSDFKENIFECLSDLQLDVKDLWGDISTWFSDNVTGPVQKKFSDMSGSVSGAFSGLWLNIKTLWGGVTNWFRTNIITPVQNAFQTACEKISGFFSTLGDGIKKSIVYAMNAAIGGIESGINFIIRGINDIIGGFNKVVSWAAKVAEVDWGGVQLIQTVKLTRIAGYENGGFPEPASLFFAGENGVPELMGTVGGRNAVAGGAEITGIRDAVYDTGQTEASLLATAVELLREIASKNLNVNLGDKEIARANNRGQRKLGYQLITEI